MKNLLLAAASALALAALPTSALADDHVTSDPVAVATANAAPLSELVSEVDIPFERFELSNGLTVIVHTDRTAPVVATSIWYDVGSTNEPKGKTGFAHLFEHIMGYGSENVPGGMDKPMEEAGATSSNATTSFDRTNYFATVPTNALDLLLMMESDRMGFLLGGVTPEMLQTQVGVVQNEKRQNYDNQPYASAWFEIYSTLYPNGHPYAHLPIGSMEDIGSASMEDVRTWFTGHYGPNNAILVLSGDIDAATAREKVTRWFGDIPAGPEVTHGPSPVPTLNAPVTKTIYDKIPGPRVARYWATPGLDNPDYLPLAVGSMVLGGLASSRLDNALVREDPVALRVSASAYPYARAGQFTIIGDPRPGVEPADLGARIDAIVDDFVANGPTEDELERAKMSIIASNIRGLEGLGGYNGKGNVLAEGLLYSGDPEHYKQELRRVEALTVPQVRSVMQKWLRRPVFALTTLPGEKGGAADAGSAEASLTPPVIAYMHDPDQAGGNVTTAAADRSSLPAVGPAPALDFPTIERSQLSNGMQVFFAKSTDVPVVTVKISFDAGYAADPREQLGAQTLLLSTMREGTQSLDSTQLAIAQERLGASIGSGTDWDSTSFVLSALSPNLAPSLDLLAEYIREPALEESDLERKRAIQLNAIANEENDPGELVKRVLYPLMYGPNHPYGIPPSGLGETASVGKVTLADLRKIHDTWLRPDIAKVFVTGDTTLEEATRLLEASFGDWKAPATAAPVKRYDVAIPQHETRIVLVNRDDAPQSVIRFGRVLDVKGTDDLIALRSANEVLGGGSQGRLFLNLRQDKGWTYGSYSGVTGTIDRPAFIVTTPVQADKTGPALAEMIAEIDGISGARGVTDAELTTLRESNMRALPGRFASSGAILAGMEDIVQFGRDDDYYDRLADRYAALTTQTLDEAAAANLASPGTTIVIVGDVDTVRPQIEALNLGYPVEVLDTDG